MYIVWRRYVSVYDVDVEEAWEQEVIDAVDYLSRILPPPLDKLERVGGSQTVEIPKNP